MRIDIAAPIIAAALALATVPADAAHGSRFHVVKRQSRANTTTNDRSALDPNSYLPSLYQTGDAVPGVRDGDTDGQYVIIPGQGDADGDQVSHCNTIFIRTANVQGDMNTGWKGLPQVVGFDLKRDLEVDTGAVLPYYEETGKDYSNVKRVVLVQPGKPRDS